MILVVSGEGPSDIGVCTNGQCECSGTDFRAGPMTVVIDQLVEPVVGFSPLTSQGFEFVSKSALCAIDVPRMIIATGKKAGYETAFYTRNAQQLAVVAKKFVTPEVPVAAVLFRDTDGTRATERGLFEKKWESIERGFLSAGFLNGVPMVPKPKSEAWLLCALSTDPYQNCAALEESLSGNDNAPNSAKTQVEARLAAANKTVSDLADMVSNGTIDPGRIQMPSFDSFRDRLLEVCRRMLAGSPSFEEN